ncbi:hypothetical protein [Streptomyces flaveolus]|uniref:hypothetical protein n=1 Tax=Streptomyces flaveolus TaxID=67297 RepID=UPI003702EE5B
MRILVPGHTGYLGTYVAARLAALPGALLLGGGRDFVHENGSRLSMSAGGAPKAAKSMFTSWGGTRR